MENIEKTVKESPSVEKLYGNKFVVCRPPQEVCVTKPNDDSIINGRSTPSVDSETTDTSSSFMDFEAIVTKKNCLRLLECAAQPYAWGRKGSSALVARMKAAQSSDFDIVEDEPYAELWLGTHPNGMTDIVLPRGKVPLLEYVRRSPHQHCGMTDDSFGCDLSFLFKVLSIQTVLSIQAHPDKRTAEKLHAEKPMIYKDPNHKPEMCLALSNDFEAMAGFRSVEDIITNIEEYPEFAALIAEDDIVRLMEAANQGQRTPLRTALRSLFRSYMEAKDDVVTRELEIMLSRINTKTQQSECDELILRLAEQFPGDSGIFSPLLFNHLKLQKGEAFFIDANEPHAYIQGEILECMACSDNVVRLALTPKLKDVDTLVDMLTYKTTLPEVTVGTMLDSCTRLYKPPVDDFCMELVEVPPGETYELQNVPSPSVLLTLEGSGELEQNSVQRLEMTFGKAAFMSANTCATVVAGTTGICLARALSNVHL